MSLPKPNLHPTYPKGLRMNLRKSIVTVTVSAAALLSLAACQSDDTTPPTTTTADAAVDAPAAEPAKNTVDDNSDRVFLMVIGQHGLPQTQKSIDAAHAMCGALDRGADPTRVALVVLDGFDGDTDKAGALIGAGSAAYCPEYTDALANIGSAAA